MAATDNIASVTVVIDLLDCESEEPEEDDSLSSLLFLYGISSTMPEEKAKIRGFEEEVVPLYTDVSFRRKFRMSRQTYDAVLSYLKDCPELQNSGHGGREPVSIPKQVLLTLWYLGSLDNIDRLADRFGVSDSSVIRCRIDAINMHLKTRFIKWPGNGNEMQGVVDDFAQRNGFPGICGALDGTHIKIKKPTDRPESYINRKGFFSIQLQAACKTDMAFTHVFVGYPGSCHDARVLKNSDLWTQGLQMCNNTNHIIADAAYPLRRWLMTPFRDNGHLTRDQTRYNHYLSQNRMVTERSFGLLKGRFRRLQCLDTAHVTTAVKVILASCIVHNICILHHDEVADFLDNTL